MKFYSSTLQKELDFEMSAESGGPRHRALEQVFYDELQPQGVTMSQRFIRTDVTSAIVETTITNGKRTVSAIGEATPMNLTTDVARAIPATMASNRSFDRAVLRYLGLYNVYAESENVKHQNFSANVIQSSPQTENQQTEASQQIINTCNQLKMIANMGAVNTNMTVAEAVKISKKDVETIINSFLPTIKQLKIADPNKYEWVKIVFNYLKMVH